MNPEGMNSVQEILSGVESVADGKIKFHEDLERIINIALLNDQQEILEKIAFHSKAAHNLFLIIQRKEEIVNEEFISKAAEEYRLNVIEIKILLNNLFGSKNDFIKNIFEEKFFQLTQTSLSNLNNLCSDLSYLKLYLNDKKHKNI
jgi:predicted small metal-binding protein